MAILGSILQPLLFRRGLTFYLERPLISSSSHLRQAIKLGSKGSAYLHTSHADQRVCCVINVLKQDREKCQLVNLINNRLTIEQESETKRPGQGRDAGF
jgi:hypothetical protein